MGREYVNNRIRELRQEKGWSLEKLGAEMRSGLTASTVAKLERRKMALSADYLLEIANALQVSPIELLDANNNAHASNVPLIPWGDVKKLLDGELEVVASIAVPARLYTERSFAVEIDNGKASSLADRGFMLIDRDRQTLESRGWFFLTCQDGRGCVAQYLPTPPAFRPAARELSDNPVPVGQVPFVVAGRVTFVGNELA